MPQKTHSFAAIRGTIRPGSPWFLRAPRVVQAGIRAYFALVLALWFVMPLLLLIGMML